MESLGTYIPMDRRQAMARGEDLPDRMTGSALFADISGFTPLTEALLKELGPKRGAEELTRQLNRVYDALVDEVQRFGGSVISFSGDAITCWLDQDDGSQATACALSLQMAMGQFSAIETPSGSIVSLAMKAAVANGPVRRFRVGDPKIQFIDVLAGATLDRMAAGEHQAERGEVLVSAEVVESISHEFDVVEWRQDAESGDRFAVIVHLPGGERASGDSSSGQHLSPKDLSQAQVRRWLLPAVYERLKAGQGRYLAEMRPAVALFLRFGGLDYDEDEDAGTKLDQYVHWVQNVLARYESNLLQLTIGDKGSYLYAAFGAPVAHDDDPERAVAVALELRSPPASFEFIKGIQVGISRGLMLTGAYGGSTRRTYGVLGDEVNLAARLMGKAQPGEIMVSQDVADAVAKSYQLKYIGPIPLKGKAEPIPVSVVLDRRRPSLQRPIARFATPLVGREHELAQLKQILAAAQEGSGQIVRLSGVSGIGKSHLAAEFAERALHDGWRVVLGSSHSTSQDVVYHPWRQIYRALFVMLDEPLEGEDRAAHANRQIAQVESTIAETNPDWLLRLPLLGDLLDLPIPDNATTAAFDPQVRQQALFALAVELAQSWSQAQPLLILLEDANWMDEASADFALTLGRSIGHWPIVLVVVQRPTYGAEKPLLPELDQLSNCHTLHLEELADPAVDMLVTNRLQSEPSELVRSLIRAQAQGNPFFSEELLNDLRESGALYRQEDSTWRLSDSIMSALKEANYLVYSEDGWVLNRAASLSAADLGIPASIHGIVLSRLDHFPEAHKLTLKVASVIGRSFEFDLLSQSHPVRPQQARLLSEIEEVESRGFAQLETPAPNLAHVFKHNITQEVVYETLLDDQQRELNRLVGRALEGLRPDEIERLAHYYHHGQAWAKAMRYNLQVAQQAQREFANDTAVAAYKRVLDATARVKRDTSQEQLQAYESLGEILTLLGQYDQALDYFATARTLVQGMPESAEQNLHLAELCRKTAEVFEKRSEYKVAFDWLEKGLSLLNEDEPTIEATRIYLLGTGVFHRQAKNDQAMAWCQKSLTVASEITSYEGQQAVARAYYLLGLISLRRGDLAEAVYFCLESLQLYQQLNDIVGQSQAYLNLATAYSDQGDWTQASDAFRRSLAIKREIGDIFYQGAITNNLANIYLYRGDWDQAASLFEQSNAIWRQLGAALPEAVTLSNLAQVYIYQEQWAEAQDSLNRSQVIFEQVGSEDFLAELERRRGEFYLKTGELEKALAHVQRSMDLAKAQEARLEEGMSSRVLGQIQLARGNLEAAEDALGHSLQILDELNSGYESAKTLISLVQLALVHSSMTPPHSQLERAMNTFEKLGAEADLAQARELARQLLSA